MCLLNKFNVVAHHTLVVTREFERQTDPLNAADFEAALQLLQVGSAATSPPAWQRMVMLQQKHQCLGWPESSATGCHMAVLQAMPHGGIAYYNCGPQSGASQAHKHLQVL